MRSYQFLITVDVDSWPHGDDRSAGDYARLALILASLPGACQLDGFADLEATAFVDTVESL